jgi:arylsulfatase A-like enzyme
MKQKILLFLTAIFCSFTLHAETTRPNVILIISDDHCFDDYGFMGHDKIKTPHLDKMAAESLLYTRGYVMPV